MPVEARLKPILALQNRLGDADATFQQARLESTIQARRLGGLVMRAGPKVPTREVMVPVHGGSIRVRLYEPSGGGRDRGAAAGLLVLAVTSSYDSHTVYSSL